MNAAEIKAAYARELKETITVRRYTGTGTNRPRFDVPCRGKATPYDGTELIGIIQQGDQHVLILVEDIVAAQMALPLTSNDKIVVRGRELAIINPAERKAPDGTPVAYELTVRG